MIVHFDGDLLVYRAGFAAEKGGNVEPLKNALYNVKSLITRTLDDLDATTEDMRLFLSGPTNFRDGIATIRPYKGNRDETHKPVHGPKIKEYMVRRFDAEFTEDEEADDAVSYSHYEEYLHDPYGSVIVSTDKDLNNTPGLHYNFIKEERYWVSEEEADRNFQLQLLTGDSVDNIVGVPGVGKVKAAKALDASEDVWQTIENLYRNAYKEDWYQALLENGRLLWMRRRPHEWWVPPNRVLEDKIPYE